VGEARKDIHLPGQGFLFEVRGPPLMVRRRCGLSEKSILSFYGSHSFIDSILPHEIAHLIFRDFVGLSEHIPVWLDEGVAQWAEVKKQRQIMLMAKAMYMKDSLLTFSDMMKIDIRTVTDKTQVYIRPTITRQGDSGVFVPDRE